MDSSNKKINWAKEIGKSLPAIAVATMGVQANASAPVSSRSRLQNKAWISEQSSSMTLHHNDVFNGFSNQSGLLNDGELPVGVYFYILNYNDGTTKPSQGRIYISR